MKNITSLALAGALGCVASQAAETTPVGYYEFTAVSGSNLFAPGFVNSAAYSGEIVSSTATTITFAASSFAGGEFNEGTFATHYVEVTTAGVNEGVYVNITSNTTDTISLDGDITALGLTAGDTVVIRPHVTASQALSGLAAVASPFTASVTFYNEDGSADFSLWTGAAWGTNDARPIPPGTGVNVGISGANQTFAVTGEVKYGPTVVQVLPAPAVNLVGVVNPLIGGTVALNASGVQDMGAFTSSATFYTQGPLTSSSFHLNLGGGSFSNAPVADVQYGIGMALGVSGGAQAVKLPSQLTP